jgi:hypothetical protein
MEKSTLCLIRDLSSKLSNAADFDSAYLTWKETGGDLAGLSLRYNDAIRAYREAERMIREVIDRTPHRLSLCANAQAGLAYYWFDKAVAAEKFGGLDAASETWDNTLKHYRKLLMMLGEELMFALHIKEGGEE